MVFHWYIWKCLPCKLEISPSSRFTVLYKNSCSSWLEIQALNLPFMGGFKLRVVLAKTILLSLYGGEFVLIAKKSKLQQIITWRLVYVVCVFQKVMGVPFGRTVEKQIDFLFIWWYVLQSIVFFLVIVAYSVWILYVTLYRNKNFLYPSTAENKLMRSSITMR